MAENLNIPEGSVFVDGPRSAAKARELLGLAEEKGIDKRLVQTTSGGYIVPAELVAGSGRRVAEEENASDPEADAEGTGTDVYDPADHNVDDVLEYLQGADEEERARVLAAEADGKNRVTITGADLEGAK